MCVRARVLVCVRNEAYHITSSILHGGSGPGDVLGGVGLVRGEHRAYSIMSAGWAVTGAALNWPTHLSVSVSLS